jgi:hypothetical protein
MHVLGWPLMKAKRREIRNLFKLELQIRVHSRKFAAALPDQLLSA